jgi:hypothetical protein
MVKRLAGPVGNHAPQASVRALVLAGAALMGAPAGLSQEAVSTSSPAPAASQVYEPAFFTRFAPRSALDMVRQIPGFTLVEPNNNRRGFGEGGVNALINGRRVTGKSGGATDTISRITPDAVLRIEVVDGASLNIPGLSGQVANIVTKPKGVSGTWEWRPQFRGDREPNLLSSEATVSGESGAIAWTLGGRIEQGSGSAEGWTFVRDASGALTEVREAFFKGGGFQPRANAAMTYTGLGGDVLNLNLTGIWANFNEREESARGAPGAPDQYRIFTFGEDAWRVETSADYEFDAGPGRLKLIGFYNFRHGDEISRLSQRFLDGRAEAGSGYAEQSDRGETIARGEYTLPALMGGSWVSSIEGAFNFLEVDAIESDFVAGAGLVEDLSSDFNARVEEKRAEVSLTHARTLVPGLDLQANIGGEYSEISQSGQASLTREFVRPKGFLSLGWAASKDFDLNLRLAREVGQLEFFDFIASEDINNDEQDSGNVDLVPEQTWLAQIEANNRFAAWGALKTLVYGRLIEDIVDVVPIPLDRNGDGVAGGPGDDGTDADLLPDFGESPGNIDSALRYGVEFTWTLNLDPVGFKGARFDVEFGVAESQVDDPVTGETRRISNSKISEIEIGFRHDVPGTAWAWGAEYDRETFERRFGLTQTIDQWAEPGMAVLFVEHKNLFGMRAKAVFVNLLNNHENTRRTFYDADIGQGRRIFRREEDSRSSLTQSFVELSLAGNF